MTKMTTTTIEMADGKSLRTGSMIVNDWDGNDGEWKRRGKREKEGKNKKKNPGAGKNSMITEREDDDNKIDKKYFFFFLIF